MSKELLLVVSAVANEKGVSEEVILEALEAALARAAAKRYADQDVLARVTIDPKDGSYETFRRWEVVAMDAIEDVEGVEVGDYIEEPIENAEFGRIAAQAAKQVIVQRVREAERMQVVDAWKDCRSRRQCRGLHPQGSRDSARCGAHRGSRARVSVRRAQRAARAAAIYQPRRA